VAALAVLGAWLHAQPSKAYQAVQLSMDRDDPALLAPWLDLPALRANIKSREAARLQGGLPPSGQGGPGGLLGLLGQVLTESVVGALVQGAATPEGVLAMLRGAAAAAPDIPDKAPRTPSERLFGRAGTELIGFDRYVVSAPLKGGAMLKLVFARQGTKWLLSDLDVSKASGDTM
jgi:hypothetical protein